MGICNVKSFFSPSNSEHMDQLAMVIAGAYYDVLDVAQIERKKFTTSDFYERLISLLKSENTPFQMEYSSDLTESQKKLFKQAFAEIKQAIEDLIPRDFMGDIKMSELRSMLENNLQKDLNAGRLKIEGESQESTFDISQEGASDEDTPVRELRLNQFIQETYGNCFGAVKQMRNQFSREIFTYSMCNFENGFFVTTNSELNESIALYKNTLLQRIVDFLSSVNPNTSYPTSIYTAEGNVHRRYYDVLNDMQDYLNGLDSEQVINDEYSKKLFNGESAMLDAINAYTTLKYFDSLLQDALGKTIKYNSRYKNTEVRLDLSKYQFSRDSGHHKKSWTDSENRTAVQNSSRFSKFVLDSIPLKVNGKDTGKNIGINQLSMTISKLFANISYLATSKVNGVDDLVNYMQAFHGSPTLYAYKIFNLINQSKDIQVALRSTIGFNEDDLGVIQSLFEYVFSYDSEMHLKKYADFSRKSIRSMEFNKLKTSYNLGKYSILSDIVGVIDDCMDATYFYTEYGQDGGITVQKRVKYKDRRGSEKFKDTLNAANVTYSQQYREELRSKCQVEFATPTSTQRAKVTVPIMIDGKSDNLVFNVTSSGILGILEQSAGIDIEVADENRNILQRVYDLFEEDSPIDISQAGQRSRLLADDANLSEDEQLFKEVLRFLDDRLLTQFLSEDGLQKLNFFKTLQIDQNKPQFIKDLMIYAVKSQIVSDIYYEFNSRRLNPDDSFINSKKDFMKFLRNKYQAFANITDEQKKTYFIINNGISKLRTLPSSTAWVDTYAQATLILQGESAASVSKNQSGNNDANYVTAFLGGQIYNVCYKAKQVQKQRQRLIEQGVQVPQTAASALLFTNHSGAIKQCVINSDVKNRAGTVKSIRDLKSSELFYNAIIHNFWSSYLATGEYCIQPTTYSDKVKLIQYLIDGDSYKFGNKSLSKMNKSELIELYRTSVGEASRLALENVVYFYSQLWGETLTPDQINARLKTYDEERLTKEAHAKGLKVMVDFHYRKKKINGEEALMINEILSHQAKYSDANTLREKFRTEEINFINNLVDSGVFFYVDYHDTSLYDSTYKSLPIKERFKKSSSPVANIIRSLYETEAELEAYSDKWIKNGKLILAYDQNGEEVLYKNVTGVSEINPILERYFYTDTLLANNLRLQLTGFETNHPDKSKFTKMWDNVAKGLGITNPLISSVKTIESMQKAKVWLVSENVNEDYSGKIITNDPEVAASYGEFIDLRPYHISVRDLKALNESFDLHTLSTSTNTQLAQLADSLMTIIENISQGTQLKRNVIVPATMHYMHNDLMEGVAKKIKVAIINDMPAKVFNFSGESDKIDSMDGSAYTTAQQSILENKSLGSQEVGADKKPIWHHYDQDSGTAGLMKFASFEINNERMLLSMNSTVPLIRMYKKMTNLPWANLNDDGIPVSWNTSHPITLGRTTKLTGVNRSQQKLDFMNDILQNQALYYRTYDEAGNVVYKQIVGFGGDAVNGYYTIESYVDEYGDADVLRPQNEQVYHYFSATSEYHQSQKQSGDHTINSLYELWLAMGGLYSQTLGKNGTMEPSESSHYAVVEFMNKTTFPKESAGTDRFDISQNSYDQPLKEMMIGYLTNNSGMKNGASNRNSVKRWFDDEQLLYMEMDSDGLGVQMDADHDVEEAATMTEFSQVIASLEAGGYLHKYAKQVYQDLGKVAEVASKIEIDTITKFLAGENDNYDEVKSDLYDILGRTLLNGISTREDQASLTDEILRAIEKRFNQNIDHLRDVFKIPFSDSNIYSQILPTVASIINQKSIKRKYPGSGCVMIPGFNVIQYFNIKGNRYTFNDLVTIAIQDANLTGRPLPTVKDRTLFEREVVREYLDAQQLDPELVRNSVDEFIPTDIVDIIIGDSEKTITLDDLNVYYAFKDIPKLQEIVSRGVEEAEEDVKRFVASKLKILGLTAEQLMNITNYRYNVRKSKNLAPVRITFEIAEGVDAGKRMNIFDLKPFRDSYENPNQLNKEAVQDAFMLLDRGFILDENGQQIRITNLKNMPAELVVSNMYSTKFGTGTKSVAQIKAEGVEAFRMEYETPKESKHYDLLFSKVNGDGLYISFQSPKGSPENSYVAYDESNLLSEKDEHGNIDVYLISNDNRKLFKVGRYIVKEGYSYRDNNFYDDKGNLIPSKRIRNLKADKSTVYEYVEFVSKYRVTERFNDGDDIFHIDEYEKYYINVYNIKKTFTKNSDSEINSKQLNSFITNILDGIYSTQQFLGVNVNSELSRDSAGNIVKFVTNMKNIDNDFRQTVMIPLENELRERLKGDEEIITVENSLRDKYQEFYDKLAQDRYSSWQQSLYFTAARIPAQTLQSFMQMEAVAYSGNSRNLVYVSHWQAWLQGSDYDIDKAYIMGQEFGDDGKLVKYSNLFDYSSLETLQASSWLPTPRDTFITSNQDEPGFDITRQLEAISPFVGAEDNISKAAKIRKIADLIIDIYDYQDRTGGKAVNIIYDPIYAEVAQVVVKDIITHERTKISPNLEESAYKNSISSNIKNIVQDLKNMDLAYSPIAMGDLQKLAAESEKGALVASMSLMNPLTKYSMQVQNMVGKKVIGIAAVGEKVFFNLSYYFNEGIRSNDDRWIRNLQFSRTFGRIQNRYAYKKNEGNIETITKTQLANVNFGNNDEIRRRFITINQIDQMLRKQHGITDQDIKDKTVKWSEYSEELIRLTTDVEQHIGESEIEYHKRMSKSNPVDLLISQILSAATDNAKELILAKINCGDALAKCHLYLTMLGFDIKDTVSFMTSPCVSLISDLSEANMMDSYITNLRIDDSMNIVDGIIDPTNFLFGATKQEDEWGNRIDVSRTDSVFSALAGSKLHKILTDIQKQTNPNFTGYRSLQTLIQAYIKARLNGVDLESISTYPRVSDYESRKGLDRMSDYIDKVIYSISKAVNKYAERYRTIDIDSVVDPMLLEDIDDATYQAYLEDDRQAKAQALSEFNEDLEEFKRVYKLANETTTLGGVFLGMNQGLPGSKTDLQGKLRKIKETVSTREEEFGIYSSSQFILKEDDKKETNEAKKRKLNSLIESLISNNQFVQEDILPTLMQATAFDLIGNFNIESWLYDKQLTAADIVNDNFMEVSINPEDIFGGKESISYRELVANYYNLIKGTWNIFDMMNRIPQYKAIIDLLKSVYVMDKHSSIKSNLTNTIFDQVYTTTGFIDEKQNKTIIKYVDDLLITAFFRDNNYSFPIYTGMEYLDSAYKTKVARYSRQIDLNNAPGRASFKLAFESIIAQLQTRGKYGDTEIPNYRTNAFIQGLRTVYDKFEVPRLSLELDMMKLNSTPSSQKLFQEYLNGFNQLRNVKINGISLSDWFILYNLYVNQNQYGSDRLTTLFKNSVVNKGSVLEKYFKYIGDLDYKKTTSTVLRDLEFNMDDLLIRMAPTVPRSEETRSQAPFIRTRNASGETVVKERNRRTGTYREISTFPNKDLEAIDDAGVTDDQKSNYQQYQMMPMKNQDFNVSLREGIMSADLETLVDTLITYSRKGLLQILKENC